MEATENVQYNIISAGGFPILVWKQRGQGKQRVSNGANGIKSSKQTSESHPETKNKWNHLKKKKTERRLDNYAEN